LEQLMSARNCWWLTTIDLAAQLVMEADALGMRMDIATDLSQGCNLLRSVVVLNLARLGQ